MKLNRLESKFAVCKLSSAEGVDLARKYTFFAKTAEEISLLCREEDIPKKPLAVESGWRGFQIAGTLDFSLVGILARISGILAEEGIPVFVVSTYDTDYIFMKDEYCMAATGVLQAKGYEVYGE